MPAMKRKTLEETQVGQRKTARKDDAPLAVSSKGNAAATRVLAIPELLEQVHLHSSLRDLFVFQRVSRTWQAAINNSPAVQQKMFLRSEGDVVSPVISTEPLFAPTDLMKVTPGIPHYSLSAVRLNPIVLIEVMHHGQRHIPTPTLPFGLYAFFKGSHIQISFIEHDQLGQFFSRKRTSDYQQAMDKLARPEASWRKMLVTQRSINSLRDWTGDRKEMKLVRGDGGLTLGDIDQALSLKLFGGATNMVLEDDKDEGENEGYEACKGEGGWLELCKCRKLLLG